MNLVLRWLSWRRLNWRKLGKGYRWSIAIGVDDNGGSVDNTHRGKDSGPTHIPLSWPRRHEGKFYAPSDPEWQEFIKISRDRQKIQSLKGW